MSVQEAIVPETRIAAPAARPAPPAPAPGEAETIGMGVAIAGFDAFTRSGLGHVALVGCKVLLFNAAVFGPIFLLGVMLFT